MHLVIDTNIGEVALRQTNCQIYRFHRYPELDHAYYEDGEDHFYLFGDPALLIAGEMCGLTIVATHEKPRRSDQEAYANYLDRTAERLNDELETLDQG